MTQRNVNDPDRRLAAALDGDRDALRALAAADADGTLACRHRVAGALSLRAAEAAVEGPACTAWRRELRRLSVHYLLLREAAVAAACALTPAGVAWLPLKGYDLATRIYGEPEERATSDLDLLVAAADFERARGALCDAGWTGVGGGARIERYLAEEGYAWQAVHASGVLLELHYRLWGSVPERFAADLLAAATADPALPPGGHRATLAHAFVLAAVHAWLSPPPRGVGLWRDLERIAAVAPPPLADAVVAASHAWDVQLPVALAAEVAAGLWPAGGGRSPLPAIAARLGETLRPAERLAATRARRGRLADASLAALTAARLMSGRRGRHRLRLLLRRLWAHPGVVEGNTEAAWPWPARRWWYQLTAYGWRRPAGWIERRIERGMRR